ncbi:MAG: adenylyl-sulfate kinase [Elusimicrobiota bacterium]
MIVEARKRSFVKAASYRVFGTLATGAIAFLATGRLAISVGIGAADAVSKIALYFVHERIWTRIPFGRRRVEPGVLWFTGLSGSGKSTLAARVVEALARRGVAVESLDGDAVRHIFPETGFTKAARDAHIHRVGHLAGRLEKHGVFVVASFISPYADSRDFVRKLCRNFVEIHVSAPLDVCERRDPKGLYKKARRGELANFTGVHDPYEPPARPELTVDTSRVSEDEAFAAVMAYVDARFFSGSAAASPLPSQMI